MTVAQFANRLAELQRQVDQLRATVREVEHPMWIGKVFLAVVAQDGTFREAHPDGESDVKDMPAGRIVSNTATAGLLVRDPILDASTGGTSRVEALLGFQTGSNAAYVPIGGLSDYYQDETYVMRGPLVVRVSRDNNTDDILEFFADTMDDGRPCLSLRFKDPPAGYPVLQGNAGNVVWDGVRLDNA